MTAVELHSLPEAAQPAVTVRGHALAWDPPAAMTSRRRWTCERRTCGRAVLVGPDGHAYGSALATSCPEPGSPAEAPAPVMRPGEVTAARVGARAAYMAHERLSALAAEVMVVAEGQGGVLSAATSLHTIGALTRRGLIEPTGQRVMRRRGGRYVMTYRLTLAGCRWLAGARLAGRIPPASPATPKGHS